MCSGNVKQPPARTRGTPVATQALHRPEAVAEVAFSQKELQQEARLVHTPPSGLHVPLQG